MGIAIAESLTEIQSKLNESIENEPEFSLPQRYSNETINLGSWREKIEFTLYDTPSHDELENLKEYMDILGHDLESIRLCDDCGYIYDYENEGTWIDSENKEVCQNCSEDYFYCEYEDEHFPNSKAIWIEDSQIYISIRAYENSGDFFYCDSCGTYYSNDSYGEDGECSDCCDGDSCSHDALNNYSYKPRPVFFGNSPRFYGLELEIEVNGSKERLAKHTIEHKDSEKFYLKRDSSLDCGVEVVTHPMSLDEHEKLWPDLIKHVKKSDEKTKSHQTTTCGLHVHVNRDQISESTLNRLIIFSMVCKNKLQRFARRKNNNYARFQAIGESGVKGLKNKIKSDRERYVAINLLNSSTIEFRFFRGTLKPETLVATVQLLDLMIDFCSKKHSLNTYCNEDAFWSRFLKLNKDKIEQKTELKNYLVQRKINE